MNKKYEDAITYLISLLEQHNIQYDKNRIPQTLQQNLFSSGSLIQFDKRVLKYSQQAIEKPEIVLDGNSRYKGQWIGTKKEGKGEQRFSDPPCLFDGYWQNDEFVYGKIITNDSLYHGDVKNHQKQGFGDYITEKEIYRGNFEADKYQGFGAYKNENEKYEGYFKNGLYDGQGYLKTAAFEYKGEFKEGKMTGKGEQIFPNKEKREGQFLDGKLEGDGVLYFPVDNYYKGQFSQGLKHGFGYEKKDNKHFRGNWVNNELHGEVRMKKDKLVYICFYQSGVEDQDRRKLTDYSEI